MKKYMCYVLSLSAYSGMIGLNDSSEVTMKIHEEWWQKNLDTKMEEFRGWVKDEDAESRVCMRNYIKLRKYKSVLDVPCGLCTEYRGYKKERMDIDYYGVDITPKLVDLAQQQGLNVIRGSIESIPYEDSFVDVCYARHILEHLDYYEKALKELIRVAKKEVIVVFFIKPDLNDDKIDLSIHDGAYLYHNRYNRSQIEWHLYTNPKVTRFEWEDINKNECALHVYLK